MNRRHVKAYFGQEIQYLSESANKGEGALLPIATMVPKHAANAARRLMRESDFWAKEAGWTGADADLWIATRPLVQALARRGMEA